MGHPPGYSGFEQTELGKGGPPGRSASMKVLKYTFVAALLVVATFEAITLAYSGLAEHEAARIIDIVATLQPGYTSLDSAKALFRSHGIQVTTLSNACVTPAGLCDDLSPGAGNYKLILLRKDPPLGFELFPFPPVKRAVFNLNIYFINGRLDSINSVYRVGAVDVKYSRGATDSNLRSSEWNYEGDKVVSIAVASSGPAYVPFPRFDFHYMYSVKCTDARRLWPDAPPPTREHHCPAGCREIIGQ